MTSRANNKRKRSGDIESPKKVPRNARAGHNKDQVGDTTEHKSTPVGKFAALAAEHSAGKWECGVCMIFNSDELVECASCTTPRDKPIDDDGAATDQDQDGEPKGGDNNEDVPSSVVIPLLGEMEHKYSTPAKLIVLHGCSIAVDLSANFPGAKVSNDDPAHMTILFDRSGFKEDVLGRAEKLIEKWKTEKKVDTVGFNLEPFGKSSDAIKGPLEELCLFIRDQMGFWADHVHRKPHVELRYRLKFLWGQFNGSRIKEGVGYKPPFSSSPPNERAKHVPGKSFGGVHSDNIATVSL